MTQKDNTMFLTIWTGFLLVFYLVLGLILMIFGTITIGFLNAFLVGIGIIVLTYGSGLILEKYKEDKANVDFKKLAIRSPKKNVALKEMRLKLK